MATTTVTPDHDTIISEIDIAAPMERVFKAISDAADIRRRSPQLHAYEMEPRVGGKWFLEMHQPHRGKSMVRHDGEILEFDPPRLLVYTWTANFHNDPKHRSIVRWELTPTKSGTHVKMTHSGLASEPESSKDYGQGWPGVLQEIKQASEASPGESMATTITNKDLDIIVSEIDIAAPPERIFQALTTASELQGWFTNPECPAKTWEMDARLDGAYRYTTDKGSVEVNGIREFVCHGHITEFDPPRVLAYTWYANWHDDSTRQTLVRWELSEQGSGTHVKVTHSGLSHLPIARKDYSDGWPGVIEMLKRFVEGRY